VIPEPPVAKEIEAAKDTGKPEPKASAADAPADVPEAGKDGRLACPVCGRLCKGNRGLRAHARVKHPDQGGTSDTAAATRQTKEEGE